MLSIMKRMSRRTCLTLGAFGLAPAPLQAQLLSKLLGKDQPKAKMPAAGERQLPMSTIFKGEDRFRDMVRKAKRENWGELPIGDRTIRAARELHGQPYESFTLEIHDHVESPSVNLEGLDCWTFFEISLGFARMLGFRKSRYEPEDLLRQIEFTRYRGGHCGGNYLERIHYLAEWFIENDARGACDYITPNLPGAEQIHDRRVVEMTKLWKGYRYLRENPDLRPPMRKLERRVEAMPVHHVPRSKVADIEPKLRDGDVIGIATKYDGGYCSHVGLAIRTDDGVMRLMHASTDYDKVVIDKSISGYLYKYDKNMGILVGRPLEVDETVTDGAEYRANLKRLLG